ncbi:MAG: hypothetical protein FWG71_09415, partial [Synergistaceae bacterium]|nr:hypothetical protein [Synergistaceae bacterium]
GARLSTKIAVEYATKMAIGSAESLYAQIDPTKLSEMNRAMQIAERYGFLLNEYGCNLRGEDDALGCLLLGYPDHGFVIDRKEARSLFKNVFPFSGLEMEIYKYNMHLLSEPSIQCDPFYWDVARKTAIEEGGRGNETKISNSLHGREE